MNFATFSTIYAEEEREREMEIAMRRRGKGRAIHEFSIVSYHRGMSSAGTVYDGNDEIDDDLVGYPSQNTQLVVVV